MSRFLLKPLSFAYGAVTALRNLAYDRGWLSSYQSALPLICVGNISAGGNGKTPICLKLAQSFKERGWHPVILSRAYKGNLKGPHLLEAKDMAEQVGDEPCLMQHSGVAHVVISKDRVQGVRFIESKGIGDVVILDDGFQHRRLKPHVSIVCVNISTQEAIREFLRAELLPSGLFREPRSQALKRADFIIFFDRTVGPESPALDERLLRCLPKHLKVLKACYEFKGAINLGDGRSLQSGEVVGFCGIANPEGFLESLVRQNFVAKRFLRFSDHHNFSKRQIEALLRQAGGLPLLCTSKDAVKLKQTMDVRALGQIYEFQVQAKVFAQEEFLQAILFNLGAKTELRGALEPSSY